MKITKSKQDNYCILAVEGKVNLENNDVFREAMQKEIEHGNLFLGLDLSRTIDMDSQTIGLLVHYWKLLRTAKGELAILNPSKNIIQIFEATKLDALMRIVQNTPHKKEKK